LRCDPLGRARQRIFDDFGRNPSWRKIIIRRDRASQRIVAHQDKVVRLDVAVDHAPFVGMFQAERRLTDPAGHGDWQRAATPSAEPGGEELCVTSNRVGPTDFVALAGGADAAVLALGAGREASLAGAGRTDAGRVAVGARRGRVTAMDARLGRRRISALTTWAFDERHGTPLLSWYRKIHGDDRMSRGGGGAPVGDRHRFTRRLDYRVSRGDATPVPKAHLSPPTDGRYSHMLAVRDLASGQQLLWLPAEEATGRVAADALAGLFMLHGAPLVLKCDNGAPFTSGTVRQLNHDFDVKILFSPPRMPRYNGAIEAGIGSLKVRTEHHAARHGRPGQWIFDDVAAATLEANATARPLGLNGPTPDEQWAARSRVSADERTHFAVEVERQRSADDAQGRPAANPDTDLDEPARERQNVRRALEGLDYLTYTRRRLPLPIRKKKVAIIP
jgi:hypothetical protein